MKVLLFTLPLLAGLTLVLLSGKSEAWTFGGSGCGTNRTHNFYFGRKAYYDRLLYINHTKLEYNFLRKRSVDVDLPPIGQPIMGMITYIEVLDQYSDGNGGCAYIRSGGIGMSRITLHLKSQWNRGIDFVIRVYGH